MEKTEIDRLLNQGEVIIALLGRIAFHQNEIYQIVTQRKTNPEKYVEGYNACDGKHTVTELAEIIGVSQPTLSPILQKWADIGIIYEVVREGGTFYRRILLLQETKSK
jgi:DNA-binding MarR family transcriptional regulator